MKKKQLPIWLWIVIGVVVIGGIVGVIVWANNRSTPEPIVAEEPVKKKKISVPSNIIALDQRPYIEVVPFAAGNGRSLRVIVDQLIQPATTVEYLVENEVGGATSQAANGRQIATPDSEDPTGLQGAMGEIDLASLPAQAEFLLGSCSAGGACTHYTGLGLGKAVLTFTGGTDNYAVSSPFNYIENDAATLTQAQSADQLFTLESPNLKAAKNYLILQSAGLPTGYQGTPLMVADAEGKDGQIVRAYQVSFTTKPSVLTNYSVSFGEAGKGTSIMAYSQATGTWTALETTCAAGTCEATGDLADLYLLVK